MTKPAAFRQADLERAVKVALRHGLAVKVVRDGAYLIPPDMVPVDREPEPAEKPEEW